MVGCNDRKTSEWTCEGKLKSYEKAETYESRGDVYARYSRWCMVVHQ